jgi:hypothetical protein
MVVDDADMRQLIDNGQLVSFHTVKLLSEVSHHDGDFW